MASKTRHGTVHTVKDQYEAYPYPPRDPEDDRRRLMQTLGGNLDGINHFVFGGRRDFSKPFRVLVAGGGTGDALIYLAQQLADRGCPAEVVYLDLSTASRAIAEKRAAIRKLKIAFHTGSLLDAASLGLGRFDYIDCSGVLHHLPDPDAGLAALTSVLAEDGGMGLMLYGTLGRSGIYPMQAMLRQIAPPSLSGTERVAMLRRLHALLPDVNLLKRNPMFSELAAADEEVFDLYLHSQDRSYTVSEIGALAAGAGLRVSSFVPSASYEPAAYCGDPAVLTALAGASAVERATFAEAFIGLLSIHIFYAVRAGNSVAAPVFSDQMVPVWHDQFVFPVNDVGRTYQFGENRGVIQTQITVTPAVAAVARLIDGKTALGEIRRRTGAGFDEAWRTLWSLHGLYYLFLRGR